MWICKKIVVLICFCFLFGCSSISIPNGFVYREIRTSTFRIASWQKVTNPHDKFKIYIEGDGASFDAYGEPTDDPTPRSRLVRELAFGDRNSNVIYLARPCQFVFSDMCSEKHWVDGRFSPEVVTAMYEAVLQIAGKNEVVLVGFSGGAQVAGLISVARRGLNVKKIITIGGNLDHLAWTMLLGLPSLSQSMNLENYREEYLKIEQKHYVGSRDDVVPKELVYDFVGDNKYIIEEVDANHNDGWNVIYSKIWSE